MAKELARINYEKQREEKMRQHIKANRYTLSYLLFIMNLHRNTYIHTEFGLFNTNFDMLL